jgi:hypothetical protein
MQRGKDAFAKLCVSGESLAWPSIWCLPGFLIIEMLQFLKIRPKAYVCWNYCEVRNIFAIDFTLPDELYRLRVLLCPWPVFCWCMPKSMKSKTHHNHLSPLQTSGATASSRRKNTESQSSSPRVTTHWTPVNDQHAIQLPCPGGRGKDGQSYASSCNISHN